MVRQLEPLGSPARVRITKVVRTSYRIEWEYDGHSFTFDSETGTDYEPARKVRVRHMQGRGVAYRAAAMRLIFSRRDRWAKEVGSGGKREGCKLCDVAPVPARYGDESEGCRYHDSTSVERLRDRLARWLLWRDARVKELLLLGIGGDP